MRVSTYRFSRIMALGLILAVCSLVPVQAADKNTTSTSKAKANDVSGSLTQSYTAGQGVQIGMIVKLDGKNSKTVTPVKPLEMSLMLGIVIPPNGAPITLTPAKVTNQQVLVATSGRNDLIVSNQGGPIKVGDYVTVSDVSGVGMKAGEDQQQVVGRAAGEFSGTSNVVGTVKLKDTLGKEISVSLGRVPVDIEISHNPLYQKTADYVPGFLAKAAVSIAQKPVSVARIYLSSAILLLASIITANMLYSGVRNGMMAVGRNPLSKKSIIKSLIQTTIGGLIVFISGVFTIYLLLKL
jgi:hypothetical protein